ncbi:ATP/GTP-binding protein [Podospora didyma]|uniref:ATP/GTP-binding protein n=1 Tax=Podospora didyma TaxID=330526 RepID=A0AAE0N3U7_9PEZI|nr:ATP/GTP-binding protein [Podospora didyma]
MDLLERLQLQLTRTMDDPRPIVLMTCGIAGSGKSTLSKAIIAKYPDFERLSNDNILHANHGLCGTDYLLEKYDEYLDEADLESRRRLVELLDKGEKSIVLDRSLYSREDRNYFKEVVESKGARWILVFFRPASKELIWKRIQKRRENGINADSALGISRELLDRYWDGFENPEGEGEITVDVVE